MDWNVTLQLTVLIFAYLAGIGTVGYLIRNSLGKRVDDQGKRIDDLRSDIASQFNAMQEDMREIRDEMRKNNESLVAHISDHTLHKPNLALATGPPNEAMQPVLAPPDASTSSDAHAEPPVDDGSRLNADTMPLVDEGLSPVKRLYLEYWTALKRNIDRRDSSIKVRKPQPESWMGFAVGRAGFGISVSASKKNRQICVGLTVKGPHARSHFERLRQNKIEIESEIGAGLEWQENPSEHYIRLYRRDTILEDRQNWGRQLQWLYEQLEIFYRIFVPRVQAL